MTLRPAALLVLPALALASLALADVTSDATVSGKGLGLQSTGPETTQLSGLRLRKDGTERGKAVSYIYDLEGHQVIVLDHTRKQADVYSMTALAAEVESRIGPGEVTAALTPTGASKEMLGQTCQEYGVAITVPTHKGEQERVTVHATGSVWLTPGGPGHPDYTTFWKAAGAGGIYLGNPSQAKSTAGQVRAIATLYQKVADVGVPCATNIDFTYEGDGAAAKLMQKLASEIDVTTSKVVVGPIPADRFAVPAGYATRNH